jgi:uncharacterized membrane protein YeiB
MSGNSAQGLATPQVSRITSIDALRGFVMFMMIFVNDLAGAPEKIVPDWMAHFSDRHQTGSGMTFVDLVFPAFLFLVGMSIPFALGSRLNRGEARCKIVLHVVTRTLALLALGILMVNGESGVAPWWWATMFTSGILAFCTIHPPGVTANAAKRWQILTLCLRIAGFAGMIYCAFVFQDKHGNRMLTLAPFFLNVSWNPRTHWLGLSGGGNPLFDFQHQSHRAARLRGVDDLFLCRRPKSFLRPLLASPVR